MKYKTKRIIGSSGLKTWPSNVKNDTAKLIPNDIRAQTLTSHKDLAVPSSIHWNETKPLTNNVVHVAPTIPI